VFPDKYGDVYIGTVHDDDHGQHILSESGDVSEAKKFSASSQVGFLSAALALVVYVIRLCILGLLAGSLLSST
jgi:hypothetical protein